LEDPEHAPRRPNEHAMRVAKMKVGQPHPRADKRFLVEAFWVTLDLRFTLASLAQSWLEAVGSRGASYSVQHQQMWVTYIRFILRTCCQDARIAFDIADQSESRRQVVKTTLYCMRAELERFRFNIYMVSRNGELTEAREELLAKASQKTNEAKQESMSTAAKYLRITASREGKQWLEDNFTRIVHTIIEEWSKIEDSLRSSTFYQPVSLEEQMGVVRALRGDWDFAHTGHFYRCPNGHTYVIGDCGGATERAACPECGAVIGGTNHTLDPMNVRATDFEDLARQLGAQPSPWRWGV